MDVEDYYHVTAFAQHIPVRTWDQYPSRVVVNTLRLLTLLERHAVKGTFFVLGWVAEHYPALVQAIRAQGHEVGCHSYSHQLIYHQTPEEFEQIYYDENSGSLPDAAAHKTAA